MTVDAFTCTIESAGAHISSRAPCMTEYMNNRTINKVLIVSIGSMVCCAFICNTSGDILTLININNGIWQFISSSGTLYS